MIPKIKAESLAYSWIKGKEFLPRWTYVRVNTTKCGYAAIILMRVRFNDTFKEKTFFLAELLITRAGMLYVQRNNLDDVFNLQLLNIDHEVVHVKTQNYRRLEAGKLKAK